MIVLQAWKWSGDLLMALMYAFAINVMIESPFDRLQKNVMKIIIGSKNNNKHFNQLCKSLVLVFKMTKQKIYLSDTCTVLIDRFKYDKARAS